MKLKGILFSIIILIISTAIGLIFWEQEIKYALPTPVPTNFVDHQVGEQLDLTGMVPTSEGKSTLLHFFNYDCPCSKFNMKEFERLAKKYEDDINFYVIIQSNEQHDLEDFKSRYELDLPTLLDKDGRISDLCGIYSTPQAVILDQESTMFFKGNYNKARFCTRKETRFVDMAIQHLIKGESLPAYFEYALTQPYGCTLPSDEEHHLPTTSLLNLFN